MLISIQTEKSDWITVNSKQTADKNRLGEWKGNWEGMRRRERLNSHWTSVVLFLVAQTYILFNTILSCRLWGQFLHQKSDVWHRATFNQTWGDSLLSTVSGLQAAQRNRDIFYSRPLVALPEGAQCLYQWCAGLQEGHTELYIVTSMYCQGITGNVLYVLLFMALFLYYSVRGCCS